MKKFIKKILILASIAFLLIFVLQAILSLSIKNISIDRHDNLDLTLNNNSDLIFMGSSRCFAHFAPSFFDDYFNLKSTNIGMDGHAELSMTYFRLLDYLKGNTPPKYALLNFDPFTIAGDLQKASPIIYNKDKFSRYAYVTFNKEWETVRHFGYNNLEKYLPLYAIFKYRKLPLYLSKKYVGVSRFEKYGYGFNNREWDTLKHPEIKNTQIQYPLIQQQLKVKKALIQLNDLCASYGIKLICIQTPVHESIFSKSLFNVPKRICEDINIVFIDVNYESIRSERKNFYNSNHLNTSGIAAMNNKLKINKELIKLLE
jgi:hypothetical protein